MKINIYYFSGTGNCQAVAKQIAQKVNADIVSISSVVEYEKIHLEQECIGIVFPAYLTPVMGLPLIVVRFINKIENLRDVRIFAVCTCGGYPFANAFAPLEKLSRLISNCGGNLREAYSVRLPMNNLDYAHIPVPISSNTSRIIKRAKQNTERIAKNILLGKRTRHTALKWIVCRLVGVIYRVFRKTTMEAICIKAQELYDEQKNAEYYLPLTDRSIKVRQNCTGCGICVKVCPVQNIVLNCGIPEFLHRCEACFACDEWCPVGAIQHWGRAEGLKYHHPSARLSDMLKKTNDYEKGQKNK